MKALENMKNTEECFYIFDTIDDYEKNLDNLYPGINKYVRKWKYINK